MEQEIYNIKEELTTEVDKILNITKQAVNLLAPKNIPEQHNFHKSNRQHRTEKGQGEQLHFKHDKDPNKEIVGFLEVDGYLISAGSFVLKMGRYTKSPLKTAIVPSSPLVIREAQRGHHLAQRAYKHLKTEKVGISWQRLIEALEDVMVDLQDGIEELQLNSLDNPLLGPGSSIPSHFDPESFHPPLPRDVVLDFGSEEGSVRIDAFILREGGESGSPAPHRMSLNAAPAVYVSITCPCVVLHEALNLLSRAFKECMRLRDKLSVLRMYE
eukprot:gb/GECH01006377.1/.p1 GENE.gb/GECH01006377.1/~~gb/GECH01006377.1/.p1  ORF type:complete len:270 (+),score=50.80 gb/GECH01006377.1/:1-810(+)